MHGTGKNFKVSLSRTCRSTSSSILCEIELTSHFICQNKDKQGNPSHIHAILRTVVDISTKAGLDAVMCKIKGSLSDLIHHEDFLHMKENGLISSVEQLQDILQDALSFLTHRCHERCQVPKIDEN